MAEGIVTQVPGNVWKILVKLGDHVKAGEVLFILEVMKTEVPHEASQAGIVQAINIHEGQEGVDAGIIAMVIG
jgi:acetyl-CoA carboxylase biotin carboxyl carrier protein